eukprot:CAMPEP_0171159408 /NCGR_PEP_ID=MMETSP0790-20130122/3024_1 /TAXON_ID=2925 /ORGANISM="Alexandrium catenella, Strain OF101" /LENGTH=418 /DNA_ID=CAMNT_0011623905 /DNA_START=92 /DNA_END=1348 /DNA_ORIENTATION=+
MALASVLPVLFECRFGVRLERLNASAQQRGEERPKAAQEKGQQPQQTQKGQQLQGKEEQHEDQKSPPQREWPCLPLGFVSVLLFIAAEAVSCWTVFVPSAKAGPKGKGKTLDGPLGMLIEASKKAITVVEAALKKDRQSGDSWSGSAERITLIVMEALTKGEAFDAVHSISMLVAFLAVTISMVGHYVPPLMKGLFRKGRSPVRRGLFALVPVMLFGILQWQSLVKVWKALQAKDLIPALPGPLRVAALLVAAVPGPGKAPEVPMFAVLQAGSLMASISAEIANGRLPTYMALFFHGHIPKTMVDSRVMTFLVPTLLALTWVSIVHLRRNKGFLLLAMLASAASSPLLLIHGWKQVAPVLGVTKELAKGLSQVLSVLHVACGLSLLMAGGTLTIMSLMFMGNLLVRIHGYEAFVGLLW